jgi:hypothetical protein
MHRSLLLVALLSASVLGAQEPQSADVPAASSAVTIDAGMTRAEVVARLGAPAAERTSGSHSYLFFGNGCPLSCGTDDLVILQDGRVSDAIFRGGARHYSGASSSPVGVVPVATLGARAPRATGTPLAFDAPESTMVEAPAPRDARPAARPALAADEPASAQVTAPAPAATPAATPAMPQRAAAAAPSAAPQPSRRAPVEAFRVVPIDPGTVKPAAPDSTSRPR